MNNDQAGLHPDRPAGAHSLTGDSIEDYASQVRSEEAFALQPPHLSPARIDVTEVAADGSVTFSG